MIFTVAYKILLPRVDEKVMLYCRNKRKLHEAQKFNIQNEIIRGTVNEWTADF